MAQRHISAIIAFFAVLIVQHGMAVRERAAAGIFTGNAHRRAFGHQACISDGFGHAPINRLLAGGHGLAAFQQLFHRIVQRKALRHFGEFVGQTLDIGSRQTAAHGFAPILAAVFRPIHAVFALVIGQAGLLNLLAFIQRFAVFLNVGFGLIGLDHAFFQQFVGIKRACARMLRHFAIHHRLG